ncbi:membrane-associated protein [Uxmal virus]|uniref:Membrane-associated protein n=1 Tax=Uxmal virus TaxID=2488578 RepID=A0A3G5BMK1_9VIRU|nr:membrane-associated protein [Uxmal virus]
MYNIVLLVILLGSVEPSVREYNFGSLGRVLPNFLLDPPLRIYHAERDSYMYGKIRDGDIQVYHSNAWSKFLGIHCPPDHKIHYLSHSTFSDLYICVHVPVKLDKFSVVYVFKQPTRRFVVYCKVPNQNVLEETVIADVLDLEYYVLIQQNNKYYFSSVYCIGDRYRLDSDGNEKFVVNYTTTDSTIRFQLPKGECHGMSEVDWDESQTRFNVVLPFVVSINASDEFHACLNFHYTPYESELVTNTTVLPISATTHLVWSVDVETHGRRNVTRVWSSLHEYPSPSDTVIHIQSAISNSPFNVVVHTVLSLIRPIIDVLVDSLVYVFNAIMQVLESSEFAIIIDRIFNFLLDIVFKILGFFKNVVYPKLLGIISSLSFKYQFLLLMFLYLYLRTTKFWFTACIVAIIGMCLKERS